MLGHKSLASLVRQPQNQYCLAPALTSGVAHAGSSSRKFKLHLSPSQIQLDLAPHIFLWKGEKKK